MSKQLETFSDFKALYDTPGGKALVDTLAASVISNLSVLAARHKELTHQEFISLAAEIDVCMNVAYKLIEAEKFRSELVAAMKAAGDLPEEDTP